MMYHQETILAADLFTFDRERDRKETSRRFLRSNDPQGFATVCLGKSR
jgi:hypothetical protein